MCGGDGSSHRSCLTVIYVMRIGFRQVQPDDGLTRLTGGRHFHVSVYLPAKSLQADDFRHNTGTYYYPGGEHDPCFATT